jgi:hypothetical protein
MYIYTRINRRELNSFITDSENGSLGQPPPPPGHRQQQQQKQQQQYNNNNEPFKLD